MPVPSAAVLDDFNRADGAPGANWTANPFNEGTSAFTISSNTMRNPAGAAVESAMWWNLATYGADCEASISITTTFSGAGTSEFKIGLRMVQPSGSSSTADGYLLFYSITAGAATVEYNRIDNAVATTLGAVENVTALASGDRLGFMVIGATLQAYRYTGGAWATYAGTGRTDTTYTTPGYVTLGSFEDNQTAVFDNFAAGSPGSGSAAIDGPPATALFARRRRRIA